MGAVKWELLGPDDSFDEGECAFTDELSSDFRFNAYAHDGGLWSVFSVDDDEDFASGNAADREGAKRACEEAVARELARREELATRFANAPPTTESLDQFVRAHVKAVLSALGHSEVYRFEGIEKTVVWLHADKGRAVATTTHEDDARVLLHVAQNNTEGLDHEVPSGCCRIVARVGEHTVMGAFSLSELNAPSEVAA